LKQSVDVTTAKQIFLSTSGGIIGGSGKTVLVWQYVRLLTDDVSWENVLIRTLRHCTRGLLLLLDSVVRGVVHAATRLLDCGRKTSNADQVRSGAHPDSIKWSNELAAAGLFLDNEFRSKLTVSDVSDLRRVATLLVKFPNEPNLRE
jgi:hypothetical protein